MTRPLFRTLVYLLVAGQVLMSAPVVAAMSGASAASAHMPCADSMPAADDSTPCPCCPDSESGLAACLSACAATAAPVASFTLPQISVSSSLATTLQVVPRAISADPPLKPPPIV